MMLLSRLASILRWRLTRKKTEKALNDELEMFIEMAAEEKTRAGVEPTEARRLARLELGGIEQAKERVRTHRHGAMLDEIERDLRYAFRMLGRNRGLTATIVITLALGIGANTAIFSLIDSLMLRWLPVRNPQELALVTAQSPDGKNHNETFSYVIVRALADQPEIFAGVAGFTGVGGFNIGVPGSTYRVPGAFVTGGFYETLGLEAADGRVLTKADDEAGAPLVAVISYAYWERQFARSYDAIGRTIVVESVPVTIVGVSPAGFTGANVGDIADLTLPVAALPQVRPREAGLLQPGNFWFRVLARPKRGLSNAAAEARLAIVWPQISGPLIPPRWPAWQRDGLAHSTFELTPGGTGWTYLREIYRKPLWLLMSMVGVVLLIGCANVASLLLARASARESETAVRLAIGAGRGRIVRQFLIESTLLSLIGAAFGVGLAWFSSRFLLSIISAGPARVALDLTPNWHVLGFTALVAIVTGILFGLAPAVHLTAVEPSPVLNDSVRMSSSHSRLLPSLVSLQVALSLVLLLGASLFVRTLKNLKDFDLGFNRDGVVLVDFEAMRKPLLQEVLDEIRRVPGVTSASVSTHTPLSGSRWSDPVVPKGQALPDRDNALLVGAGPHYFETMQTRLIAGREFDEHDTAESPSVAVINEVYANRFFPNRNPIGEYLSAKLNGHLRDLEIVGIAANTRSASIRRLPPAMVYVSHAQLPEDSSTTLEIRATGSLSRLGSAVTAIFQQRMPTLTTDVRPLSAQVEATFVQERLIATLAAAFGGLALMMACLGIYGLLAFSVARRTKEMGIRMALGARGGQVVADILKSAAWLVLIGVALGLPAAWAASRWVETLLFGVKASDPATMVGSVLLLAAAGLSAAYLPARRASRVNPLTALHHD